MTVRLFGTPWTAARQASLSITNSQSLLKLMFIALVRPSNHLILCRLLLLLPSIFPSIRVFSNESVLCIRWLKYWSFSISPSNEYSGLISFRIDFHPYEDPDPALENSEWPPTRFCQLLWVISGVRGRVMTQHSPLPPNPFHALSPPGPRDAVLSMWAPPTPSVSPAAL